MTPAKSANISIDHLNRLFLFRSSMIVAEVLLLTVAIRLSHNQFPLLQVMLVMGAYALFNLITWIKQPQTATISPLYLFIHLCIDVFALTLLLYYTGGANNPFVSLFLLPLLLVAAIFPKPYIWSMALITTACYAILLMFPYAEHQGMAHMSGMAMTQNHAAINTHAIGMAVSFLLSVVVVLFFVVSMAESLRDRERKLAAAHEKSLRDEHVVALGTLAAGAAHELGTPLGTMAILTHEMEREYADDAELVEQIQILRTQVDRCKSTISQMSSSAGQLRATGGKRMDISDYIQRIGEAWQHEHPAVQLHIHPPETPAPKLVVDDTLQQALISLLNNASDAGATHIQFTMHWDDSTLHLCITDDGAGLPADIQATLGKPFVSTKAEGQGLGFYLAQAVISRMGGHINIQNQSHTQGACVTIQLPLQDMRA